MTADTRQVGLPQRVQDRTVSAVGNVVVGARRFLLHFLEMQIPMVLGAFVCGKAVHTPVWFVAEAGRLYVRSSLDSGKAKRIRNNPRLLVAACSPMGKPTGPVVLATARILRPSEEERAAHALLRKYGWQMRIFDVVWRVSGHQHDRYCYLEIALQ